MYLSLYGQCQTGLLPLWQGQGHGSEPPTYWGSGLLQRGVGFGYRCGPFVDPL